MIERPCVKCWNSSMKLATEIARELFLYGPAGGLRVTSVAELVRQSGAAERTIREHLPGWRRESEELAASSRESGLVLSLSTAALDAHKADCDFLRQEVDRLKLHLRALSPAAESYAAVSRAMLATERQWAAMAGVSAALEAAGARLKEKERLEARAAAAGATMPARPVEERPRSFGVFAKSGGAVVKEVERGG